MYYAIEQEIRKIVREELAKLSNKDLLSEMSVPLKKYRDRIDGLRFQLVENWCLCKYCQLFSKDNVNFTHWKVELKACIDNLKFLDIKNGKDKKRVLKNMLIDDYDYDNTNMIMRIMVGKFKKEGFNKEKDNIEVCSLFADSIEDLINVISIDSLVVEDYISEFDK